MPSSSDIVIGIAEPHDDLVTRLMQRRMWLLMVIMGASALAVTTCVLLRSPASPPRALSVAGRRAPRLITCAGAGSDGGEDRYDLTQCGGKAFTAVNQSCPRLLYVNPETNSGLGDRFVRFTLLMFLASSLQLTPIYEPQAWLADAKDGEHGSYPWAQDFFNWGGRHAHHARDRRSMHLEGHRSAAAETRLHGAAA